MKSLRRKRRDSTILDRFAGNAGVFDGSACAQSIDMNATVSDVEGLTEKIIGCAIEVHRTLGPGLLESVYRECLAIELALAQLRFETERRVPLSYRGVAIGSHLRMDVLVEDLVVVEIKAIDCIHPIHLAQGVTYLKLSGRPAGLILNFNTTSLRAGGIRRLSHPSRHRI